MDNKTDNSVDWENRLNLTSRKKWFWVGLIITLVNPVFAGLVIGAAFLSEPALKKEGKIIITLAVAWGVVLNLIILPRFMQYYQTWGF